jgi:hypothetical protein
MKANDYMEEIKRINYFRIAEDDFGLSLLYRVSVGGSKYITIC